MTLISKEKLDEWETLKQTFSTYVTACDEIRYLHALEPMVGDLLAMARRAHELEAELNQLSLDKHLKDIDYLTLSARHNELLKENERLKNQYEHCGENIK
jgi:hypothetical protein